MIANVLILTAYLILIYCCWHFNRLQKRIDGLSPETRAEIIEDAPRIRVTIDCSKQWDRGTPSNFMKGLYGRSPIKAIMKGTIIARQQSTVGPAFLIRTDDGFVYVFLIEEIVFKCEADVRSALTSSYLDCYPHALIPGDF
jgi:hypothetical protein